MIRALLAALLSTSLIACANMQRSTQSGYGKSYQDTTTRYSSASSYDSKTKQVAYELGKDPATLSPNDLVEIRNRQKLKELERTLISNKEREQYSKVLPWLRDDQEKISFLSIPSLEGRQQWINKSNIWARTQVPQQEMKELIENQDVAIGMPQDYVRRSWGDPISIESSGNPIYRNERWKYQRQVSTSQGYRNETRYVYFEGGRVVGWETE